MTSAYPNNPPMDGVDYPATQSNPKGSLANSAQSALNGVQNHPLTQNVKETVSNGPVGQTVKQEYSNTANEFQNVANSRVQPAHTAANGQPLTHYHSMFYNILSWENPRVTAIAFVSTVALIFATRYVPVVHYACKLLYLTLGATATAEIIGKVLFSSGFASQMRPRKYYTLPKETVDQVLEDIHELLNFFVIEFQRILFVENIYATVTAFFAALTSYFLIKIVPFWGLALIAASLLYITPFVYINNKEAIDAQIQSATDVINQQASQVKDLANQHTAQASETIKSYAGDYSSKAQDYLGSVRQRNVSPSANVAPSTATRSTTSGSYKASDFPTAPQAGPKSTSGTYKTPTTA
ncbi:MAG: hypothetical protein M1838_005278 [Thelocarpon superellum]|nr:MAG: hypothetical protein M1838_005278 [Thelocarpon superellum]